MYYDIDLLSKTTIPNDELFDRIHKDYLEEVFHKPTTYYPFRNQVTLSLVNDTEARRLARMYILELLRNKYQYGFLYFLADQDTLSVPLKVNMSGSESIVENKNVIRAIENIASSFVLCHHEKYYAITCVELLYFFIRLVNTHLNYVQTDYMIRCIKTHQHLIAKKFIEIHSRK